MTELSGRELDYEIGRRLFGYHTYHYDKSGREHQYWMLKDGNGDPVNSMGYGNQRPSEAKAWDCDCPRFSSSWQFAEDVFVWLTETAGQVTIAADMEEWSADHPVCVEALDGRRILWKPMPEALCRLALWISEDVTN